MKRRMKVVGYTIATLAAFGLGIVFAAVLIVRFGPQAVFNSVAIVVLAVLVWAYWNRVLK